MSEFCPAVLAYIDPATGSLVVQAVIAAMLSAGIVFRRVLFNPLSFFKGGRHKASAHPASQPEGDASQVAG